MSDAPDFADEYDAAPWEPGPMEQLDEAEVRAVALALKPTMLLAGPMSAAAAAGIVLAGLHRLGYKLRKVA